MYLRFRIRAIEFSVAIVSIVVTVVPLAALQIDILIWRLMDLVG